MSKACYQEDIEIATAVEFSFNDKKPNGEELNKQVELASSDERDSEADLVHSKNVTSSNVEYATDGLNDPVPSSPTGGCSSASSNSACGGSDSDEFPTTLMLADFGTLPPPPRTASPSSEAEVSSDFGRPRTPSPYMSPHSFDPDAGRGASQSSGDDESSIAEMMQIIKNRPKKLRKRVLSTPPTSPEKKKAKVIDQSTERTFASSIRTGMEQGKGGLFKFFRKLATEEDKRVTVALWREGREDTFTQGQGFNEASDAVNDAKREHQRDLARSRKRKERSRTRKTEIARGDRSPGGTKRKVRYARYPDSSAQ